MERRDATLLPGSGSYYIQRGMASGAGQQSGIHGSQGFQQISSQNMQFQSNVGGGSSMDSLQLEPISTSSTHSVDVSPPTAVQQKKRGRPRKYGPDRGVSLGLTTSTSVPKVATTASSSEKKRGRGRPPGSGRKNQVSTFGGSMTGMGFTPHVITIAVGEDITTKIMSFSQQGPRAVCILSANGSVSTVTLAQPSTSGGTLTYEGRFEIICLSGSYSVTDSDGSRNRSGGLSVSLASPDGRVIGGGVGGMLIAASPVQVIVGSFLWGNPNNDISLEVPEDTTGSERHGADHPVTPGTVHSNQTLMPNSSMGGWPHMRPVDMRDAHTDIDLMRE